jgi:hypothetical protein
MDIEGAEYAWISSLAEQHLQSIAQLAIQFHGVNDDSWETSVGDKVRCFRRLNETHYVIHVHGNDYGGIIGGIPDVLEVTYSRKDLLQDLQRKTSQLSALLPIIR